MSKYLISTTETYRVDNADEAKNIIEEEKSNPSFTLSKYSCVKKEKKAKGEVIDEWYRLSLTKVFTDEKDPLVQADVNYNVKDFEVQF